MIHPSARSLGFIPGLAIVLLGQLGCRSTSEVATFETPEAAAQALADLAGSVDPRKAEALFGLNGVENMRSGDPVADKEDAMRTKEMIREKLAFEDIGEGQKRILIGKDDWPFPYPLVKVGERWAFDAEAGEEELLNRRVGRNELLTIATLRAYVEAQREYRAEGRDGNPPAYAQKMASDEGRRNGLWWPAVDGKPDTESPLGPLTADASAEGYRRSEDGEPLPYHGYYFRILTGQGKSAPGGERSYIDAKGLMTGGFAAIAWPATYGNSGIMTFLVNQQGIIFQKDLGESTEETARAISAYDPDHSWDPVVD